MLKKLQGSLWIILLAGLLSAVLLAGCGKGADSGKPAAEEAKELNLFIWSEYIPQSVIDKFEKKYGIKVNYTTYSSNEEMLAKLAAGASQYDLSVATDYMVEILRKKDMAQPIDLGNVPNFKNIGDEFKNTAVDPGNKYTVPYMWGAVPIAVNTEKVKHPITSYKDLWSPEFENSLVVLDDQRAIIGAALKKLGYSLNETDPAKLEQAKEELKKLMPNIKAFDSDSPKTLLINGEAKAALVWGAEVSLAVRDNPNIKVVFPTEGMYLWQDNFFIPKDAPHKKAAELFINFILEPDISAEISKAFPYANPNLEAHKLIDQAILNDPAVYPPKEELAKGEHLKDVGEATAIYDRIWSEVKQR